jgi:V/A-type H+-transporting ATPase subunit A
MSSLPEEPAAPRAAVVRVEESLVTLDVSRVAVRRNEVGHILHDGQRLKGEVLRVRDDRADMQVFEDTHGVRVGEEVELSGELLSVTLAPGLLGQVYDGLQNPLAVLADRFGFFLPRGVDVEGVDETRQWDFTPSAAPGDTVRAGDVLGSVPEGHLRHKIMAPFDLQGSAEVVLLRPGSHAVGDTVARLRDAHGREHAVTLRTRWPVKRPLPEPLLASRLVERLYPREPLVTGQRIIDTFFPVARGGTACIPGPFGAGKTVLQNLVARHADVDVVVIIACGERAGEVVETIHDYPEARDPRTGRSLMERTVIVCNTSSMPVAAREASIYTGITIGEYYRQMGLSVLCIADSTSRWAQAMRETSGRMEEIPGEEAFPAYLDSTIKSTYERAGLIACRDGTVGSLTLIGTVSPAGGNFEEPVTQSTLATVKTFLGLSAERAYRRAYPAIDPLQSWSRYLEQLREWYDEHLGPGWVAAVEATADLLADGDQVHQMMQVTGEEGVSLEDFVLWQKAQLVDMAYLQQDAFDAVDASATTARQRASFTLLRELVRPHYAFEDKEQARSFFTRLTDLYRNWNYAAEDTPDYGRYIEQMRALAETHHHSGTPVAGDETEGRGPTTRRS